MVVIDKFWMVKAVGGGPTAVQHKSYAEASREATRLAKCTPGVTFVILEAIGGKATPKPAVQEVTIRPEVFWIGNTPPDYFK